MIAQFAFAAVLAAQEQKQREPYYHVQKNLVAIPVYVTDRDGVPVRDLTKDDFEVFEGRTRCRIEAVEFIDHTVADADAYAIAPPESRRQFLLLFDLSFSNPGGLKAAREAGLKFIEEKTAPNDLIAAATVAGRGGIDLLCPFTTDHDRVYQALAGLGLKQLIKYRDPAGFAFDDLDLKETIDKELFELIESTDRKRYAVDVDRYINVMRAMAVALLQLHGRKNLVLFSDGFDETAIVGDLHKDQQRSVFAIQQMLMMPLDGDQHTSLVYQNFVKTLDHYSRAGAVIYVVNTARLQNVNAQGESDTKKKEYSLFRIAHETNGILYKNLNNLDAVLDDIAARTAAGYVVLFEPSRPGKPGEFREVKIKVNRRGLHLDHQKGYLFEKDYSDFTPQEKLIQLGEYVSKDIVSQRIPFTFDTQAFAGNERFARLPVVLQIEGQSLFGQGKQRKEESVEIEIYGYLLDSQSRPRDFFYNVLRFTEPEKIGELQSGGLKYYDLLVAPPGRWKVKCIVRDSELGLISSGIQVVDVPDFNAPGLRISGPVFVDATTRWLGVRMESAAEPGGRRAGHPVAYPFKFGEREWSPVVNPEIDPSRPELLFVRTHGLERDVASGAPRIDLKFSVINQEGETKPMPRIELADQREDSGAYDLLFRVDLSALDLEPGQYRLRLTITDTINGSAAAADTSFVVPEMGK